MPEASHTVGTRKELKYVLPSIAEIESYSPFIFNFPFRINLPGIEPSYQYQGAYGSMINV